MGILPVDVTDPIERSSNKVLVIANEESTLNSVAMEVVKLPGLSVLSCVNEEQYHDVIAKNGAEIIIAIVDVSSCSLDIVDDLAKHRVPTVSLFKRIDDCPRISGKHVVSHIDKDDIDQMVGLSGVIEKIFENRKTRVIVLHQDSKYRDYLQELLLGRFYTVLQAADVAEAMELLTLYPDTQLLLLDENHTKVGNIEVIQLLRRSYSADHLSIISLIAQRDAALVSALFDSGASDVVATSTDDVEFLARVQHQAANIVTFRKLKNRAFRDTLTEAYTMEYFRDVGDKIFENAIRDNFKLAIAVLNIDSFSVINERHGAEIGNLVLRSVTEQLNTLLRKTDFIVRKEGDEFICLISSVDREILGQILERARAQLESNGAWFGKTKIPLTVTIGATSELGANLENMLTRAEMALLQARKEGRNRVDII